MQHATKINKMSWSLNLFFDILNNDCRLQSRKLQIICLSKLSKPFSVTFFELLDFDKSIMTEMGSLGILGCTIQGMCNQKICYVPIFIYLIIIHCCVLYFNMDKK